MDVVFMNDCAVDGCYNKNTYSKDGKQMCEEHQAKYEAGEKLIAFYGKTVQKKMVKNQALVTIQLNDSSPEMMDIVNEFKADVDKVFKDAGFNKEVEIIMPNKI